MADPQRRQGLAALRLIEAELARAAFTRGGGLAAEIRLTFWREALEDLARGVAGGHPALDALMALSADGAGDGQGGHGPGLLYGGLPDAVEARFRELDPRPFPTAAALKAHLAVSDGPFVRTAGRILAPEGSSDGVAGGRALGLMRLARAAAAWRALGRSFLPADWAAAPGGNAREMRRLQSLGTGLLDAFRTELRGWPEQAFPAAAHGALVMTYVRGGRPSPLERRLRILWAAARGGL